MSRCCSERVHRSVESARAGRASDHQADRRDCCIRRRMGEFIGKIGEGILRAIALPSVLREVLQRLGDCRGRTQGYLLECFLCPYRRTAQGVAKVL